MVDIVKGGERAPPPSPGSADFTYMIPPESGHCHSAHSVVLSSLVRNMMIIEHKRHTGQVPILFERLLVYVYV
jgi:hypothetical protein